MKLIKRVLIASSLFFTGAGWARDFIVENKTSYPASIEVSFQYGPYNVQRRTVSIAPHTRLAIQPDSQQRSAERAGIVTVHTITVDAPPGVQSLVSVERSFPYREITVGACRASLDITMNDPSIVGYDVFFACE